VSAWRFVALVGILVAAFPVLADFSVETATARLERDIIRVDARIDFGLSDKALEALDNGVPLVIVVEATVEREDAWFWQRNLVTRELRYELRFHPLAGLYEIKGLDSGIEERFATRETAISMLGELRNIEVVSEDQLEAGVDYEMALRAYLDIESLPLPLRPLAYITPGWHLSTGWSRWRLRQ